MKIIAGEKRGHPLKAPKGKNITRPALGLVREAIFSILGDVNDWTVLDVFAGTGSLGFEALSRGAQACTFVEAHPKIVAVLKANMQSLNYESRCTLWRSKMPYGIKRYKDTGSFDLVFCDPPYDKGLLNPSLQALLKANMIDDDSTVVVEHTSREIPETPGLACFKTKKYGQTLISFLKKQASPENA